MSTRMVRFFFLPTVLAVAVSAQQPQPQSRVITIPQAKGIYYDGPDGIATLPYTLMLPFRSTSVREYFSLGGHWKFRAEISGPGAALAIANPKPMFYMRGYQSGTRLYLVRTDEKQDYREIKMEYPHDYSEWSRVSKGVTPVEVDAVAGDLISITPRGNLEPGEYVILTSLDREERPIQLSFEFALRP